MIDGTPPHSPDGGWQNWRPTRRGLLTTAGLSAAAVLAAPPIIDGIQWMTRDPYKETPEELDRRFEGAPVIPVRFIDVSDEAGHSRQPWQRYALVPQENTLYYVRNDYFVGSRNLVLVTAENERAETPVPEEIRAKFAQIDFPNHSQPFHAYHKHDPSFSELAAVFELGVVNDANRKRRVILFDEVAQSENFLFGLGSLPVENPTTMDQAFHGGFRILYEEGWQRRDDQYAVKAARLDPASRRIYQVAPATS